MAWTMTLRRPVLPERSASWIHQPVTGFVPLQQEREQVLEPLRHLVGVELEDREDRTSTPAATAAMLSLQAWP